MPKARAKPERRVTSDERGAVTVWRFVDWEGRFAPGHLIDNHDVPKFIKWGINAWQGSEGAWITAMNRLRADKEFVWLQGAVVELLTAAMNQSPEYQGYLVTGSKVPMTASMVGSMLRVEGRRALAVLTRLEQVGILERVEWPVPDGGVPDGGISDKNDVDSRCLRLLTGALSKTAPPGRGKRGFRGEKGDPPLSKSKKVEKAAAQQEVEGRRDETPPAGAGGARLTCPHCGHVGKAAKAAKGWGAKAVQCTECGHVSDARQATAGASVPPRPSTSIPSTNPDGGEGPGRPQVTPAAGSGPDALPVSVSLSEGQAGPQIVRLGEVLAEQGHRYSEQGNAYGEQVCAAAGYMPEDHAAYRNEVAHWAKLWDECAGSLSDDAVARVKTKVMRVAGRIRNGHIRCESPQAYLERTMQNEIRDQKRARRVKAM